jgi:hypothetical protein
MRREATAPFAGVAERSGRRELTPATDTLRVDLAKTFSEVAA